MCRPIIDVGIVAFLIVSWGWNLPDGYLLKRVLRPWSKVIIYCGFWHGWNMFAPDPLRINRRWDADLFYGDGAVVHWSPLDCSNVHPLRAFFAVRERKFLDNLVQPSMAYLRAALCDYLSRIHSDQERQVVRVELHVSECPVSPPQCPSSPAASIRRLFYVYQSRPTPDLPSSTRDDADRGGIEVR